MRQDGQRLLCQLALSSRMVASHRDDKRVLDKRVVSETLADIFKGADRKIELARDPAGPAYRADRSGADPAVFLVRLR